MPDANWRIALHCARALLDLRLEDKQREALREQLTTVQERLRQWLTRWVEGGILSARECAEAGDALSRSVEGGDVPIAVHRKHAVGHGIQHGLVKLLLFFWIHRDRTFASSDALAVTEMPV